MPIKKIVGTYILPSIKPLTLSCENLIFYKLLTKKIDLRIFMTLIKFEFQMRI